MIKVYEIYKKPEYESFIERLYSKVFGPKIYAFTTKMYLAKSFVRSHNEFIIVTNLVIDNSMKFIYDRKKELLCFKISTDYHDDDKRFIFMRNKDKNKYIRKGYEFDDSTESGAEEYSRASDKVVL